MEEAQERLIEILKYQQETKNQAEAVTAVGALTQGA
jgi:hypothetical protein